MTYNPLEQASIALSRIGLDALANGMPQVQAGLDCLSAHLTKSAGDADEQVAEGLSAPHAMAEGLSEAVTATIGCLPVPACRPSIRRDALVAVVAIVTWNLLSLVLGH